MIVEAKALVMTPATKPGVDLYDVLTFARTSISHWQDKGEDHLGPCLLRLCHQGSEVLIDLAQVMLSCAISTHTEKKSRG